MRQLAIFFYFIVQSFLVKGQQAQYHSSARDKIINKSWECVRFCINDKCHLTEGSYKDISYFQGRDVGDWVGKKYESRLSYSAASEDNYRVDSLDNYIKNSGSSDPPILLFIDSNSKKEGSYIVVARSPLYGDDTSIHDNFFDISFLSDTEYVTSWIDRFGTHKAYYKLYNTPLEFYDERKITPH